MKINIELDTEHDVDLSALVALVHNLAGRVLTLPATDVGDLSVQMDVPAAWTAESIATEAKQYIADPGKAGQAAAAIITGEDGPFPIRTGPAENPEGAPDVDSRGFTWDERIHAGTKATNADGSWRNKRGVDKDLVLQVEAELRGDDSDETRDENNEVVDVRETVAPEPPAAPTETDAPPPPAPIPPAEKTDTGEITPSFKDAMAVVTAGQRDGSIDQTAVTEAAKALGLTSVVDLAKPDNAHLRAAFIATLG